MAKTSCRTYETSVLDLVWNVRKEEKEKKKRLIIFSFAAIIAVLLGNKLGLLDAAVSVLCILYSATKLLKLPGAERGCCKIYQSCHGHV